jgi:hypothetical protein
VTAKPFGEPHPVSPVIGALPGGLERNSRSGGMPFPEKEILSLAQEDELEDVPPAFNA